MKKLVIGLVVCALAVSAYVYGSKFAMENTKREELAQVDSSEVQNTTQGQETEDIDQENEDGYEVDEIMEQVSEEEQLNSYLSEIQKDIQPETPGSYAKTLRVSVEFLDWATYISLDEEEMREQIKTWISDMEEDEKAMFEESLYSMDEVCEELLGEEGRAILEANDYMDSAYPWNEKAEEALEILMEVAGVR